MRIIGGLRRGRALVAPAGQTTRPTADRVRQALFDMLLHAPWSGRSCVEGAHILDAFAGTGALGLEALSRGGASCHFMETDRSALQALRSNIAACGMEAQTQISTSDATAPPRAQTPCSLIFLDPPYRQDLPGRAMAALRRAGWVAPDALVVVETAADEAPPFDGDAVLAERRHGAACLRIWRDPGI